MNLRSPLHNERYYGLLRARKGRGSQARRELMERAVEFAVENYEVPAGCSLLISTSTGQWFAIEDSKLDELRNRPSVIEGVKNRFKTYRKGGLERPSGFHVFADVRGARLKAGLTQKQVADEIGVSQSAIAHIEAGDNSISGPVKKGLERVLCGKLCE